MAHSTSTTLTAGVTLSAVEALRGDQQTFTGPQVSYLIALVYQTGKLHAAAEDFAEVAACWREFAEPAQTREQRVAERHAEMDRGAEREQRRQASRPKPLRSPLADVAWPPVAVPGTVNLADVQGEWVCPCPRTGPKTDEYPSGHVTPKHPDRWALPVDWEPDAVRTLQAVA